MHGSTGIDLAYTGAGVLGGAISFGHHVWDHAAGVALVRAAGGVVTDLAGEDWTPTSRSALAGEPSVHAQILEIAAGGRRAGGVLSMDVAVRVIPCLDVDDGRVVKGVNFENLRDAGDPVELAAAYDAEGADELTFLDVTASSSGRSTMLEVVRRTAEQVFIPLTVGGGVRSIADVDTLLRAGADKVSVNTAAIARPELLAELSRQFGSQCIVLSVDARTVPDGSEPTPSGWEVTTHGGRRGTGIDAVEWARRGAELGVGEILLNSMDADGTKAGFDLRMLRAVRAGGDRPGDRQRRRGRGGALRARGPGRSRCGVGGQHLSLRRAHHRPGQGGDGGRRDRGAMSACAKSEDSDDSGRIDRRPAQARRERPVRRGRAGTRHRPGADGGVDGRRRAGPHAGDPQGDLLLALAGEQWVKGETSGHTQYVHSVRLDCDGDTVLLEVDQVGAACHTGEHTCFDADEILAPESCGRVSRGRRAPHLRTSPRG